MILKHINFLLILALLLLSLTACNAENDDPIPAPPTSTSSSESEPDPDGAVVPDLQEATIAKVLKRGYLVAGVKHDFKPFGFLDEGEQLVGFDVDLIQAMADEWGIEVQFAQVTSADRIPKLAAGEVDMLAASMTHKKDREEEIDFSQTYFLDGQSLLVRQESGITGIKELDGKTVTAIEGSSSIEQIESYAAANNVTIDVLPFLEYSQALEALKAGSVDALTTDSVALNQYSQDNPELIVVGGLFTEEPYGMGLPVGDSYFRNLVDFTLQRLKANGVYDDIYTKWFGGAATAYQIEEMPGEWAYTFSDSPLDLLMPAQSVVDKIEREGRFVAGVKFDFTPFGFLDKDNQENDDLVGFDVDIMKEFARRWLGDENAVEFVQVTSSDRIPKLIAGEVDMVAASMTHNKERDEEIDFSQTYFLDGQSLLVRADSGINGLADLDGKTVTAIEGSTSIDNIQAKADELAITIDMLPFLEYEAALEALKAGQVDALTTDSVALSQFAKEDQSLIVVGGRFTSEPYGIGVPNFDHRFRDLVNFTLQAMKEDGSYDRLYQKWFGNETPYEVEVWPGEADYLSVAYQSDGAAPSGASGGSADASDSLSKIERIRQRDNLLLAGVKYDFKPFGFVDDEGQVVGFDVDLIQAMADQWGINVEFVQVTSSDRIPKLAAGEVDMVAASMTHKKERDETIDFSQTYFLDGQSLLVSKKSGIEGIAELDGKTISAIAGSTSIDNIQAYADANDITIEILPFQEYPPAIEALKAGTVEALTSDSVALLQFAQDNPELAVVGGLFTEEPYGMGLPSGDSYFNNLVNFTLQDLKANGTYDELYHKWFGDEATPYDVELMPGEWSYTFADSPTALDTPTQSKVEMILSQGGFTAGVKFDFAPFGSLTESGELAGFDVDIMKEFAKRWLGDEEAVEFVQVTSSDRIPKLAAGEVDIVAASMTHKRERDETIDFSQTYFLDGQSLLVRKESEIKSLTDLDDKRVTAIQGSTSIDNIQAQADELAISIEIVPLLEYPPAIEALKAGQVDALTTDSVALSQFAKENPELKVVGGRFTSEPYGIGLPNYDDSFRDLVNFTLQEMKIDGTYNRLYEKWFGNDKPYAVEIWPGESYLNINTVPMLHIPGGDFSQGSNSAFPNEAPEQVVTLDEFYIDQYEVTNFLYIECVMTEQCTPPKIERAVSSVEYFSSPAFRTYPVIWVTWEDANNYCRFAGKRLPSEAEWEKAARGSDALIYPWGNEEPSPVEANFISSGHIDTMPVGSHPAGVSPYGVHDMAGNVREWVNDWYARDYYQNAPSQNPPGASEGVTKVVRGGAWNDVASDLRTTRRKDFLPESFDGGLGFRCASSTFPPTR